MIGLGQGLSVGLPGTRGAAGGFVGVLDGFTDGLEMCYSNYRALLSSFTGAVGQGRNARSDEPYDLIQAENREIDADALLEWVAGGTVTLVQLADQSGNGHDIYQGTVDSQRILVDGGELVTVGGKAASRGLMPEEIYGGDGGGSLQSSPFSPYTGTALTVFLRGNHDDPYAGVFGRYPAGLVDSYFTVGVAGASPNAQHPGIGHFPGLGGMSVSYVGLTSGEFNPDYLLSFIWDGSLLTIRDGTNTWTLAASPSFDFNTIALGVTDLSGGGDLSASTQNRMQEMAVWFSDQTANESAIRSAMMA